MNGLAGAQAPLLEGSRVRTQNAVRQWTIDDLHALTDDWITQAMRRPHCAYFAMTYAATSTTNNTIEKSAGTGKRKRHDRRPMAKVATAITTIIGRAASMFVCDRLASCQISTVSISMKTLSDQR
jgi:hypothetical protein